MTLSDEAFTRARLDKADNARLRTLSERRLTKHTRRVLEQVAAERGVELAPVDADGYPLPGSDRGR